ncbi:hypothetical protein MED193_14427 [Roseobacter sp. MED193]|nr:hypothetical protein MED193_14427 [Roseobacter sp. MED193]
MGWDLLCETCLARLGLWLKRYCSVIYLAREGEEREEGGVAPAALAAPPGYFGPNETGSFGEGWACL